MRAGGIVIVRVAQRVDVAHAPVDRDRLLQNRDEMGAVEIARLAGLDVGIAGRFDQDRQVADLQIEPVVHQDVRLPGGQDHARPGIDHVRILVRLDEGGDLHLLLADLVGDAADPWERGHDLDLGESGRGG